MRKIGIALVGDYELLERIFFSILIYKKRIAIATSSSFGDDFYFIDYLRSRF